MMLAVVAVASGHFAKRPKPSSAANIRTAKATTATTTQTAPAKPVPVNPLATAAARRWIGSRHGQVSAAVLNLKTGREWLWNRAARDQTASIIKADILETLLYEAQQKGEPVSSVESETAEDMIEASDDDDASDLWDEIGAASGIAAYDSTAGLTQTKPNVEGYWGETYTSAADQIKVLEQLVGRPKLLTRASRGYELYLMHTIDPGQTWGVTGGVPKGVSVALKNGWVPLTTDSNWEINSIGWVKGDHHDYLIAVLTAHDPSEQYGIDTIDHLSADVYAALGTQGLTDNPLKPIRGRSSAAKR
jgi:beta-lactamase class A